MRQNREPVLRRRSFVWWWSASLLFVPGWRDAHSCALVTDLSGLGDGGASAGDADALSEGDASGEGDSAFGFVVRQGPCLGRRPQPRARVAAARREPRNGRNILRAGVGEGRRRLGMSTVALDIEESGEGGTLTS